jgi:hypothetical protein
MTNKLDVVINSLKVPSIKKILLYEMKFLIQNYSCFQNTWLGGYRPQISVLSVISWICWNPPPPTQPNKILGYAAVFSSWESLKSFLFSKQDNSVFPCRPQSLLAHIYRNIDTKRERSNLKSTPSLCLGSLTFSSPTKQQQKMKKEERNKTPYSRSIKMSHVTCFIISLFTTQHFPNVSLMQAEAVLQPA